MIFVGTYMKQTAFLCTPIIGRKDIRRSVISCAGQVVGQSLFFAFSGSILQNHDYFLYRAEQG